MSPETRSRPGANRTATEVLVDDANTRTLPGQLQPAQRVMAVFAPFDEPTHSLAMRVEENRP